MIKLKDLIKDWKIVEQEDSEYDKFFKKAMDKFGVSSPDEFESDEKKKEFFDYVDKNWDADNETD